MALTVLSVAYPFAPVGPDAVGGAEQVLSALDRALVERGHQSVVVAMEGSEVAGTLVPVPAVAETAISEPARERAWARHRAAIAAALERWPVDLVHLHGIDFHAYVPAGVPTLATLHLPLDWYPETVWKPQPNLWLHGVSEAQHATCPPGARLLPPIPNGVSPKLLATRQRKRGFAMMLGRICPEKGVHLALQASRRTGRALLIGGAVFPYAAHRRYFEEEVKPLLNARRRFLGPLGFERKRRLLAAADCLLVPSLAAETSSLVAMEALACGTPVIAYPNGALPETVEDGRTGFIVQTMEEMADAMRRIGEIDPETCKTVAAERFSLERMTDSYLDLYSRLTGEGAWAPSASSR